MCGFPARPSEPAGREKRGLTYALEELLELHRRAHVALDLELAGHVGARRVQLARDDPLEVLLRARDRAVRVGRDALGDFDLAVVDRDGPLAGAADVEDVGVRHPRGAGPVHPALEALEQLAHALGHGGSLAQGTTGSTCSRRPARDEGSGSTSRAATTGAAAQT